MFPLMGDYERSTKSFRYQGPVNEPKLVIIRRLYGGGYSTASGTQRGIKMNLEVWSRLGKIGSRLQGTNRGSRETRSWFGRLAYAAVSQSIRLENPQSCSACL